MDYVKSKLILAVVCKSCKVLNLKSKVIEWEITMATQKGIVQLINNFNLHNAKTKWEVIGKLVELYLNSNMLRVEQDTNFLKEHHVDVTNPFEKYRAEILELIKILANSTP